KVQAGLAGDATGPGPGWAGADKHGRYGTNAPLKASSPAGLVTPPPPPLSTQCCDTRDLSPLPVYKGLLGFPPPPLPPSKAPLPLSPLSLPSKSSALPPPPPPSSAACRVWFGTEMAFHDEAPLLLRINTARGGHMGGGECDEAENQRWPPWLKPLLATSFFGQCKMHADAHKCECNMYCLDCVNGALCSQCLAYHHGHHAIQVRTSRPFLPPLRIGFVGAGEEEDAPFPSLPCSVSVGTWRSTQPKESLSELLDLQLLLCPPAPNGLSSPTRIQEPA
uniref:B box-type domain-containing protein n=1 Tax=Aegilops tauschii subsp. strangulata TaxID=200361 RepID=A0A453CWK0_AEGTS